MIFGFFSQLELGILYNFPVMRLWLEYSFFFVWFYFELIPSKYMPASRDFLSGSSAAKHIELFPK